MGEACFRELATQLHIAQMRRAICQQQLRFFQQYRRRYSAIQLAIVGSNDCRQLSLGC